MNRPLHILGIETTPEFGPKYKATINGFLRANNCGESTGYFFTRVPIKGGVTEAIFLLGTRGYVVVDYQFAPLSCGMVHLIDPETALNGVDNILSEYGITHCQPAEPSKVKLGTVSAMPDAIPYYRDGRTRARLRINDLYQCEANCNNEPLIGGQIELVNPDEIVRLLP